MNIEKVEIKIYPIILESDQASALWHLMRAIDINGSGKVSLTFTELLTITGYTKSTIYRYMKSTLFIKVCKNKNKQGVLIYSFYYKSLKQVALTLGIKNLITSSFCNWEDIKQFYTKRVTATEIMAMSIQNKSRYLARNSKNKNQRLMSANQLIVKDLSFVSDNTQGIKQLNNRIFIDTNHYAPYGASQQTIANVLDRNIKTINKRLKNTIKVQQFVKRTYTQAEAARLSFLDKEEWTNNSRAKYILVNSVFYERYTNFYMCSPIYTLKIKKLSYNSSAGII